MSFWGPSLGCAQAKGTVRWWVGMPMTLTIVDVLSLANPQPSQRSGLRPLALPQVLSQSTPPSPPFT